MDSRLAGEQRLGMSLVQDNQDKRGKPPISRQKEARASSQASGESLDTTGHVM